ncbi:hypothetical protein QIS99_01465 [Streptomyces sp. B-S-A8]|uniref:Uncharacterized protein n=1 Tax=Streptomyces solicavernae TaxID=3043614 RepID=A0ABT6RKD3_9ACTN|nr:hypothetical protein [Streptomyces sp. B-S-A8]MDI3384890.1 hypothetical protein [Streptomyces sp. B-S-A8]
MTVAITPPTSDADLMAGAEWTPAPAPEGEHPDAEPADPAAVDEPAPGEAAAVDEPVPGEAAAVDERIVRDADAFGVYARTGGWAFALKVARSVRPGGQSSGETPKVSAKRFGELAGCSPERVLRFYRAWDAAADDGLVPQFEALEPGAEIDLPDADTWLSYYVSRNSATSARGTAITAAAEAEGIRPTKALEVAENPTALRAAILADPSTAQAARAALLDRVREDPALQTELARDIARTDVLKKAVAQEAKAADRIGFVRQIAEQGALKTPAGQKLEAPAELRQEAERHLSLLDELDGDEEAGEWATEAYDTVRDLAAQAVEEAVERDPELRVQERRTNFYSSLDKATKVFEELTLDDADDIYEDDMVQRLEQLQQAIGACITALRKAAADEQ